ncbi:MAG: LysR substrate-binding domain-containing protein [Pseudomonadota bacterium]
MSSNISRLSLRGLRTFCIAARYESFRLAAEELFVTASAVSHQIKGLEQDLGLLLFDRNSRSLSLTEVGRSLFEDTQPLIQQLDSVVASHSGSPRSTLRISVQPFFASELFVPQLSEFSEKHPDIDLQVDTSDESSEKIPAKADVSIRLFRSPPPAANADLLFPLRLIPAGSLAFYDSVVVKRKKIVSKFPIIVHDTRPKAWQQWSKKAGIQIPKDTKVIRLDSMIAVARAAERGLGAALIPVPLSNAWFDSGSLVPLFERELIVEGGYYVICKEDRADDENVRVLREWVLEKFAVQAHAGNV